MFLDHFDMLIFKNKFKKQKKYFNVFLNKKNFEN